MFKSRSSILSSLLHRDPDRNAKAIAILQEIQNITDRNDIMHGVTGGHQNLIWFNRRRVNSEFRSKFEHYEMRRLFDLALKCGDLSTQLLQAHGIPSEEYAKFFQEAHNSANRP